MFVQFFFTLRKYGVPVSITELLDLLDGLISHVVFASVEDFYTFSRTVLVKDETFYDRFDRAFSEYFEGIEHIDLAASIPEAWLLPSLQRQLSAQDKEALRGLGSLEELMKQFKERLAEQEKRHAGGNKWIGTGGTSPFGAYGYNPEGIRVGQQGSNARRAVKVWDQREFKDLDNDEVISNRSIQVALRALRKFARTGAATELDLDGTIKATSQRGGWLDLQWQPERHNAVKILILFDVGGSMDDYIYECEQLFSAVRSEFKHLEFYYFHNCVYEGVWKENKRRLQSQVSTRDLIQKFGSDYKLIFVGDATMGPYEIAYPGGSVEHWNEEPGALWMERLCQHFNKAVWLNPQPQHQWRWYPSIQMIDELMSGRMQPLTVQGLQNAIRTLV